MRIAHILWSMKTGGTENMVTDIASIQSESNEVGLFVLNNEIEQYMLNKLSDKVALFRINRTPGSRSIIPLIKFNILLRRFNPDIIHSHSAHAINCVKVCKNKPWFRTIHGINNPCDEYPKYRKLIAISDAVRDFTRTQGFESITIWNGIRISEIRMLKDSKTREIKHIVQVGRLEHSTKGQDIVIKAISKLKERKISGFRMHFIGDGPSLDFLRNLTRQLKVEELVFFEGRIEQQRIYDMLSNYDLFVQASRNEGFGLTIAEAMAAKVPVITSDIPGPMEVIGGGKYGMSFISDDYISLSEKIEKFLKDGIDPEIVNKAYEYAMENFDIKRTSERYIEIYNSYNIYKP